MPDIGEGLTEAEIVQWHVEVGDSVSVDQIIVEVETAKTVVEIPSVFAGTITHIAAEPGDTVLVGDVLFVVDGDEERASPEIETAPADSTALVEAVQTSTTVKTGRGGARAMPLVRKLAAERGIDLTSIDGSGPGGAITRADLERVEPAAPLAGTLLPLTPMRRAIAEHMAASWREIPHVTVQAEIHAARLIDARTSVSGTWSLESVLAERLIPIIKEHPDFNASFRNDGVLHRSEIHLGYAVDTEAGLMVVVVRNADAKSTAEIDTEFRRLAQAAKDRTIKPEEVSGQTFTISNIGALGGGHGTPIIPMGTTAILSIGRANHQPVVMDGALEVAMMAPIDLSYDHRVIDGGSGQRFLTAIVQALEA